MRSKTLSYKLSRKCPWFVICREFRDGKWEMRHIHYYKHEFMQRFRVKFENKIIYKIRNWFVRRNEKK